MTDADDLRSRLAARLGDELMLGWRPEFEATPRHLFLPDRALRVTSGGGSRVEIDRGADEQGWLEAAYSEDIIVTRFGEDGLATSSCSMPYMVFSMLGHLDVAEGMTVLEIGTGTGWNAGLLAARLGPERVYSIEVDAEVAEFARSNLAKLSRAAPTVVTGDGAHGWADGAPYDRVIATCTVLHAPYAWVEQTKPGGIIVTPWGTPLDNGALLRLTVGPDATASGQFVDTSVFMWLRGQKFTAPDEPDDFAERARQSTATVPVATVTNEAAFAIGLVVPNCKVAVDRDADGTVTTHWLLAADSWALVSVIDKAVRQHGKRRLWDEVEAAYTWWLEAGSPPLTRFGVTVEPKRQWVWLDEPARVVTEIR